MKLTLILCNIWNKTQLLGMMSLLDTLCLLSIFSIPDINLSNWILTPTIFSFALFPISPLSPLTLSLSSSPPFFSSFFPSCRVSFFQQIAHFAHPQFLSSFIVFHICTHRYNSKSFISFLFLVLFFLFQSTTTLSECCSVYEFIKTYKTSSIVSGK